ncbi:hypothetical protein FA95DRAFT_1613422 [Auriscalpium vulgare]|uniref:Uncharacterized protein n=1 Tax=Auriscalpium vulgare TaxID=40419 RepID=A0ACB8R2U1_9AGAM|nr:hypothetical protein FA95DRAFT_1613422 [Auriscalpium vulgare]
MARTGVNTRRTSSQLQTAPLQGEQQQAPPPPIVERDAPSPAEPEQEEAQEQSLLGKRPHSPEVQQHHRPPPASAMDTDDDPEPVTPTQPSFTSAFATPNPFDAINPDATTPSAHSTAQAAPSIETLREQLSGTDATPGDQPAEGLAASMHAPPAQRNTAQPISHTLAEEDSPPDPFPALTPPFRIPQPTPPRANVPIVTQAQQERNARIRARIAASVSYVSTSNLPELAATDPLALTSPPFPPIHHLYPAQAWEGVLHSQVEAWLASTEGQALLLRTFATSAHMPNNQQPTVSNIGRVLTAYIGLTDPQIFPPIPSESARTANRLPKVFLIRGLSAEEASAILSGNVYSTPLVTFQALPLDPEIPSLILSLAGFLATATEADVLATVIETWNKPATLAFFDELMESTMTTEKPLTATQLHTYLSSIEAVLVPVKATDSHPTHRFSIVAKRVTLVDDDHWFQLVEHFKSLKYPSNFHGTGIAARPMFCPLCNGCDHPRGLCRFPSLTGWNGEGNDTPRPPQRPANSTDQVDDQQHDRRKRNRNPYNGAQRGQRA